ncbi:MAG TPA: hypothetical protein VG944_14295 [Fimbriimonas sp.]|nr:hypothetical protein [Fimbriimonas sp.]
MLIALLAITSDPKTFQEVEIAKAVAIHEAERLSLDYTATMQQEGQTKEMRIVMAKDGKREHDKIKVDGELMAESICDGRTSWMILDPQKAYLEAKLEAITEFDPKKVLVKCEPMSFNYGFTSNSQFGFACDPPLELKSIEAVKEGDEPLRKVVGAATTAKGSSITITQWFLADKWILKKFNLHGRTQDGDFDIEGEASKIDFDPKFKDTEFDFDPARIQGYTKQEAPAPQSGGR